MTPWSPLLETGHPNIDAEHKELFRKLASLHDAIEAGAGREKIAELITILQKYALWHFSHEEAHMRKVGCPAHLENCAAHRAFEGKFAGWLQLLSASGSSTTLLRDIHRESTAWIEAHIVKFDCQLRSCPTKEARVAV